MYTKTISQWPGTSQTIIIERWNPFYQAEVVDYTRCSSYLAPHLNFSFNKVKDKKSEIRVSDEWVIVRSILKEQFLKEYSSKLKGIQEIVPDEGEFYIINGSISHISVAYFSRNDKIRQSIIIGFSDSIESVGISIKGQSSTGWHERPGFRKSGTLINKEIFIQLLNCTLQFLSDSDSYTVYVHDFIRKFYQILEGSGDVEGFIVSAEKSYEKILKQLQIRKENLEKRLIENDSDSALDRANIRGEIEGIRYGINTILANNS